MLDFLGNGTSRFCAERLEKCGVRQADDTVPPGLRFQLPRRRRFSAKQLQTMV